jgi:hypothetical protein
LAYRKKKQTKDTQEFLQHTTRETGPPVITVDYERYAHFLENSDLTEEQKREFLQTIWNIIVEFVSLGFGVHPLQQAQNACGKLDKYSPKPAMTAPDSVYLDHKYLSDNFVSAVDLKAGSAAEGVES